MNPNEHLYFFRPGEAARLLARCQFGLKPNGECGALLTYPIPNYPWRHCIEKNVESEISIERATELFCEVRSLLAEHTSHCLKNDELWSDSEETGNGITRDSTTNTLCYTIGISDDSGSYIGHERSYIQSEVSTPFAPASLTP